LTCTEGYDNHDRIYISRDGGLTWELKVEIPYPTLCGSYFSRAAYDSNHGTWVVTTRIGRGLAISTDNGATWQFLGQRLPGESGSECEARNPGLPYYVGKLRFLNGRLMGGNDWGQIYFSTDGGYTWGLSQVPKPQGATDEMNVSDVAYGNGVYVAVGGTSTGGYGLFALSYDGENWNTYQPIPGFNGVVRGVIFVPWLGRFVAVGDNRYIATSSDGQAWQVVQVPQNEVPVGHLFDVTYNDEIVLAGSWSFNVTVFSADGVIWTPVGIAGGCHAWSVAYGEGRFAATSGSGLCTSP
jgi:hypothetical protein